MRVLKKAAAAAFFVFAAGAYAQGDAPVERPQALKIVAQGGPRGPNRSFEYELVDYRLQ